MASQPRVRLSMMSTTPAMASEPYCAAAPSRNTWTLPTASIGMVFRSVATEPTPRAPNRRTSAVLCIRLPLTSTRVWSESRPRKAMASIESLLSVPELRELTNEGILYLSVCDKSNEAPWVAASVIGTTSTGTMDFNAERGAARREPTTVTACRSVASSSADAFCDGSPEAGREVAWSWPAGADAACAVPYMPTSPNRIAVDSTDRLHGVFMVFPRGCGDRKSITPHALARCCASTRVLYYPRDA